MSCLLIDCTVAKQDTIALARRMRFLQPIDQADLALLAFIPDYPDRKEVEVSKEAWPLVHAVAQSVTIAIRCAPNGLSPTAPWGY